MENIMDDPHRHLDVFGAPWKVSKHIRSAIRTLADRNPPKVAMIDAVELLDAEGMARAPGCSLAEIRMSAAKLAPAFYKAESIVSPEQVQQRVNDRIRAIRLLTQTDGYNGWNASQGSARQRGRSRN